MFSRALAASRHAIYAFAGSLIPDASAGFNMPRQYQLFAVTNIAASA